MERFLNICLIFICCALISKPALADNSRPILGVLTQPLNQSHTFIQASYVKYLEMAGSRVVPVPYDSDPATLLSLFQSINGLLLPGGRTCLTDINSPFMRAGAHLYRLAVQANAKGDVFPIWGTCLGFEMMLAFTAGTSEVICDNCFDSMRLMLPLNFTPSSKTSRLFSPMPYNLFTALATTPSTFNAHVNGITPEAFARVPSLASAFAVLSTNRDRRGREFISAVEGKANPFYATQFHPEKPLFEWDPALGLDHTAMTVSLGQYFANFLVQQARRSTHAFLDPSLENMALIENIPLTVISYIQIHTQVYMWPRDTPVEHELI